LGPLHCHKKYKCDIKIHGTSSLLAHSRICNKNPYLANDLKQTNLVFASGEGGGLVSVHPKFDKDACRRAITLFVILDEHPFRVVNIMTFNQFNLSFYMIRHLTLHLSLLHCLTLKCSTKGPYLCSDACSSFFIFVLYPTWKKNCFSLKH
jgi:hypothetical protein